MTCREVLDFLMSYLDGELPPAERVRFDQHLAACAVCVQYLDSYRRTVELAKQSLADGPEEQGCQDVPEELVQAIVASRKR